MMYTYLLKKANHDSNNHCNIIVPIHDNTMYSIFIHINRSARHKHKRLAFVPVTWASDDTAHIKCTSEKTCLEQIER